MTTEDPNVATLRDYINADFRIWSQDPWRSWQRRAREALEALEQAAVKRSEATEQVEDAGLAEANRLRERLSALASTLAERDEALDGLRRQLAEKDAELRTRLRSEALRALETLEQTSQLFDEDSYYALRSRIEKGEF